MSLAVPDDTPAAQWVAMVEPVWQLAKRLERAAGFVPAAYAGKAESIMAAILTGAELGLGPMRSLRSLHVINGRAGLSAEAMRALVLAAGHEISYGELAEDRVTAIGRRRDSELSTSVTWTIAQAQRAKLVERNPHTWNAYPRAMLTARATAELCRLMFADVIAGVAADEELRDGYPLEAAEPEPALGPVVRSRRAPAPVTDTRENGAPVGTTDAEATPPGSAEALAAPPLPGEPGYDLEAEGAATLADIARARGDESDAEARHAAEVTEAVAAAFPGLEVEVDETRIAPQHYADTQTAGDPLEDGPLAETVDLDPAVRRRFMAEVTKALPNVTTKEREQFRHALTALVTRGRSDGPVISYNALSDTERLDLARRIAQVRTGEILLHTEPDSGRIVATSPNRVATVTPASGRGKRWAVTVEDR